MSLYSKDALLRAFPFPIYFSPGACVCLETGGAGAPGCLSTLHLLLTERSVGFVLSRSRQGSFSSLFTSGPEGRSLSPIGYIGIMEHKRETTGIVGIL